MPPQPILERRRTEAMILAHVHAILTEQHSRAEADKVIGETCSRSAVEQGQAMAQELGRDPTYDDFAAILPLWTAEDALEIEVLEQTPTTMNFNVTRCRYAEMYRDMGLGDIGHLLSCNRDGDFCTGYNPKMQLARSQTIMSGASHCDFRFTMRDNADDA